MAENWASTGARCLLSDDTLGSTVNPSFSFELSSSEDFVALANGAVLGFPFFDNLSRLRVTAFNPTTMKDVISGGGGTIASFKTSFPSFSLALFRFLSLLPLDLTTWLARYCPIGESVLKKSDQPQYLLLNTYFL